MKNNPLDMPLDKQILIYKKAVYPALDQAQEKLEYYENTFVWKARRLEGQEKLLHFIEVEKLKMEALELRENFEFKNSVQSLFHVIEKIDIAHTFFYEDINLVEEYLSIVAPKAIIPNIAKAIYYRCKEEFLDKMRYEVKNRVYLSKESLLNRFIMQASALI